MYPYLSKPGGYFSRSKPRSVDQFTGYIPLSRTAGGIVRETPEETMDSYVFPDTLTPLSTRSSFESVGEIPSIDRSVWSSEVSHGEVSHGDVPHGEGV